MKASEPFTSVKSLKRVAKEFDRFPGVLKPVKGAGSWHIKKVENCTDLINTGMQYLTELASGTFN